MSTNSDDLDAVLNGISDAWEQAYDTQEGLGLAEEFTEYLTAIMNDPATDVYSKNDAYFMLLSIEGSQ